MEPVLLFIVDDAFQIRDRGCVLVPGPSTEPGAPQVRIGDSIRLITPDGHISDTEVRGLEMINFRKRPDIITAPILLPAAIKKEQIAKGTRVFLVGGCDETPA